MRILIVFALFTLAGAGFSAFGDQHRKALTAQEAGFQPDIYYFGGTYRTLVSETPEQCATLCADDMRCRAWSHVAARAEASPFCELKRTGGLPEAQPQATSGRSPRHEARFANPPLHGLPPGHHDHQLFDTELAGGPSSH
ncbi:MAG: PAN domain-containing protein [Pseudomonadota bacterium]